jgi:hypothetical protein
MLNFASFPLESVQINVSRSILLKHLPFLANIFADLIVSTVGAGTVSKSSWLTE